jgi:hypothetical protein
MRERYPEDGLLGETVWNDEDWVGSGAMSTTVATLTKLAALREAYRPWSEDDRDSIACRFANQFGQWAGACV